MFLADSLYIFTDRTLFTMLFEADCQAEDSGEDKDKAIATAIAQELIRRGHAVEAKHPTT